MKTIFQPGVSSGQGEGLIQWPVVSLIPAPRRRERGSALLIVLVLLFTMTVLVLTTGRTLSTLQRELSLIDQKQQKKFQTGQPAEIKPKKPHAQ